MMTDDYMELGNSGLIPIKDGWFLDSETGNKIDPSGRVFDENHKLIYDPNLIEE